MCLLQVFACGDADGSGQLDGLVDEQLALDAEYARVGCTCDPSSYLCDSTPPPAGETACVKGVLNAHASELEPFFQCRLEGFRARDGCISATDCDNFDTCQIALDCDDSAQNRYHDEFDACQDAFRKPTE